ncbi:MAG: O-antigen ligase family protein [Firmicutes bacterium]|nr:O-antigen ligase family protein [Bacillota bacterium]
MSELAILKKDFIPSFAAIALLGVLFGTVGLFLPLPHFMLTLMGALVAVMALARIEFALSLLVLAVPLVNFRFNLGSIPVDTVSMCVGLVIASYAINYFGKRVGIQPIPFTWTFLVFILFAAVSSIVAPSITEAVSAIVRYSGYFALAFIVGRTIDSREKLTKILYLMIASGVASAIYGVYEIYRFMNLPQAEKEFYFIATGDVIPRIASTFGNSNFYAEYLVILIPITFALAFSQRRFIQKLAMLAIAIFLLSILVQTYTRGSWLATGVGVVLMSALMQVRLLWLWVAVFVIALIIEPRVASRLISIIDITGGSAGFRMKLWNIAIGVICEHPWVGTGIGNFYAAFTAYVFTHPGASVGWVAYGAHNSFLTIWAETGVFGMLSFAAIILISVKYGLYMAREKAKDNLLSWVNSAILAAVAGFSINGLTSNSFQHPQAAVFFWVLLGLQITIDGLKSEQAHTRISATVNSSLAPAKLSAVHVYYKNAIPSLPGRRSIELLKSAWYNSKIITWIFKKPIQLPASEGSLTCMLAMTLLNKVRLYLKDSVFAAIFRDISAHKALSAFLFIALSLIVRSVTKIIVG